jgi:hypothetical protein
VAVAVTLGCPVANREWVLPEWFRAIERQTVRPSRCVFVHGGALGDPTWEAILAWSDRAQIPVSIFHDLTPPHHRSDRERFATLARLRNELLKMALDDDWRAQQCEVFVSLDSDILLGPDDAIERMIAALDVCDIAAPRLSLSPHPNGVAYNAGLLVEPMTEHQHQRGHEPWVRVAPERPFQIIDVPMGAWAARREVIESCRYAWHESGEDIAFGLDLDRHGFNALWLTEVECVHVWSPRTLDDALAYLEEVR